MYIDAEDIVNNYMSPYQAHDGECFGISDINSKKYNHSFRYLLKILKLAAKVELYKAEIGLTVTQAKGIKDIQESN
jgi:hypothetical protein